MSEKSLSSQCRQNGDENDKRTTAQWITESAMQSKLVMRVVGRV